MPEAVTRGAGSPAKTTVDSGGGNGAGGGGRRGVVTPDALSVLAFETGGRAGDGRITAAYRLA